MMARGAWDLYKKVAGTYVLQGSIYPPNDDLDTDIVSTQTKIQLAEGDLAFFTPSEEFNYERMVFVWLADDGTTKNIVESYLKNQYDTKIVDDLGNVFVGRFVQAKIKRIKGVVPAEYDISASFEVMPNIL